MVNNSHEKTKTNISQFCETVCGSQPQWPFGLSEDVNILKENINILSLIFNNFK